MREWYIHLNAEFQRIARINKVFFNEECLVKGENNKRGKPRDLFGKIGNIKGAFGPKRDKINDKNGRDQVDPEEVKKRDGKNRQKNSIKIYPDEPDYYDGVVSHPEPDILECEVKWALRSTAVNKASGYNEIPAERFKSLKDDAIKVLYSLYQQIWKTQQWPQDEKRSIFIPIPKKGSTKECANHWTIALISHASEGMPKILHARLKHYVNHEIPDV